MKIRYIRFRYWYDINNEINKDKNHFKIDILIGKENLVN